MEYTERRQAKVRMDLIDLANALHLPDDVRPLYVLLAGDSQAVDVVVEGPELDVALWGDELPFQRFRKPQVTQSFTVDDGPAFSRSAPVGSPEVALFEELTPERLLVSVREQVDA